MQPRLTSSLALRRRSAGSWAATLASLLLCTTLPLHSATRTPFSGLGAPSLSFEQNLGQAGASASFIARGPAYYLSLAPTEATVSLRKLDPQAAPGPLNRAARPALGFCSLRLEFLGASPLAVVVGENELPGRVNYFIGTDPARWRAGAALFDRVRVREMYPGIDLVHYGNEQHLEYDFEVAPGADPSVIAIRVTGADRIHLNPQGELVLSLGTEEIRQPRPIVYQTVNGQRRPVAGDYVLSDGQTIQFQLGDYDRRLPLVIDPVLTYSTYYGGSGRDNAWAVAMDAQGFIYVAGETMAGLPVTSGTATNGYGGAGTGIHGDAFVAKFDPSFSNVVYRAYVGGAYDDVALSLAVDEDGNAYITGYTDSADFPRTNALFNTIKGTPYPPPVNIYPVEAFLTKLGAFGTNLIYSTYLGGNQVDVGWSVAVDPAGHAYVAGYTQSTNFPTANVTGSFTNYNGGYQWDEDAFITKFGPSGTNLIYSMFLGGTNVEWARDVVADAAGFALVTGFTTSTNFPVQDAFQPSLAGASDAFITVIDPAGGLVESSYLGGVGTNEGYRLTLDADSNIYLTGVTIADPTFPTSVGLNPGGIFRTTNGGTAWGAASTGLHSVWVAALAVDPSDATRVYAGTSRGIARSTDGGVTWRTDISVQSNTNFQELAPAIAVAAVYSVAVDPQTPATVYAGTSRGLFKSPDAGTNWSLASSSNFTTALVRALAIDPGTPTTLYAGGDFAVWRSTDGGVGWWPANSGIGNSSVRAIAIHPANPTTIYAATAGGVYRSLTSGSNWAGLNNGLANSSVHALVIDPAAPTTLYAGTVGGVFKSVNAGTNWTAASSGLTTPTVATLAINPAAPATLYAGTTNGLFKSTDAGQTWTRQTNSFSISDFLSLAVNPQSPNTVYAGMRGTNSFGGNDVFVTKLGANGFTATFGGSGDEEGWDIAIGNSGQVHVVGSTASTNLPTLNTSGFLRATNSGGRDAFIAELSPTGTALLSSAYLGGSADEWANGIALHPDGAYVVGETASSDFPTLGGLQNSYRGSRDAFIARLASSLVTPTLRIEPFGAQVRLSWSALAADYTLQSNTNLLVSAGWSTVGVTPAQTNGVLSVTLPATNTARFFRLANP